MSTTFYARSRRGNWLNTPCCQAILSFLLFSLFFLPAAIAQPALTTTSCGFRVTTQVIYNSPQPGQTTFRWTVQNTNPGNGKNGTYQDLGHLDQQFNACVSPAAYLSGGTYGKDKSQSCVAGDVLKFDQGTNGTTPTVYQAVFAGLTYAPVLVNAVFKGGRDGCCAGQIYGVGCCTVAPGEITGTQTVCAGTAPAPLGSATAATGNGTVGYQWQSNTTGCEAAFADVPGATGAMYAPPAGLAQTTYYRRVAVNALNNGATTCRSISNCVTVTVNNVAGGTIGNAQTICSGGDPAALTSLADATGTGPITYQWQQSTTGCNAAFADVAGATSATYDPAALSATTYYRRVATSTLNGAACAASSNCVAITATAPASLLGTQVTGSLRFSGGSVNYFNSANGFVPAGCGNSGTGSTTATIADPNPEFCFADGANQDNANFSGNTLTISDISNQFGSTNFTMTFQLAPGIVTAVNEVSDNFPNGGATFTLANDLLTVSVPAFYSNGNYAVVYSFTTTCGQPTARAFARASLSPAARTAPKAVAAADAARATPSYNPSAPSAAAAVAISASAAPNPHSGVVKFVLRSAEGGPATLELYNLFGQRVGTLFKGEMAAGQEKTIDYTVPTGHGANLVYKFQVNDKHVTGRLLSIE